MLELLPHYARLTATLTKCLPEFAPRLVELLQEEFTYLNSKKMAKEKNIESKIRNVRFIAELTKFKVFPYSKLFNIIQVSHLLIYQSPACFTDPLTIFAAVPGLHQRVPA